MGTTLRIKTAIMLVYWMDEWSTAMKLPEVAQYTYKVP
jgi:hypothetical protein